MVGVNIIKDFEWVRFSECDIHDEFFDSLKSDYNGFESWFDKKSKNGDKAFILFIDDKIKAFLYLKEEENEEIKLTDGQSLSAEKRLKIGTLKLSDDLKGRRIGEGVIRVALWKWQELRDVNQIYVTIFDKHTSLIELVKLFGFKLVGHRSNREGVYVKDKNNLDYTTAKSSFPYIDPDFQRGGYLTIYPQFHDALFPDSRLKNIQQNVEDIEAANGITKDYIATPTNPIDYKEGDVVFIYRISEQEPKRYKSAITSFGVVTKCTCIKLNGKKMCDFKDFVKLVGNKSVFSEDYLKEKLDNNHNIYLLEFLYNGYFGEGHNVINKTLTDNGLFGGGHPYHRKLTKDEVNLIFKLGEKDVQNIIIDKA